MVVRISSYNPSWADKQEVWLAGSQANDEYARWKESGREKRLDKRRDALHFPVPTCKDLRFEFQECHKLVLALTAATFRLRRHSLVS